MVSSNGFSLMVPEASVVQRQDDFASLPHNSEYSVELRNDRPARCDATIAIDGVPMGTFRIEAHSSIRVERPAGAARKFTFLREGSGAAIGAGITSARDNGLIKVEFQPERMDRIMMMDNLECTWNKGTFSNNSYGLVAEGGRPGMRACAAPQSFSAQSFSSGGTALGQSSDQRFGTAGPLRDIDMANRTVLHLRLVVGEALMGLRSYSAGSLAQPHGNAEPPKLPRWSSFAYSN